MTHYKYPYEGLNCIPEDILHAEKNVEKYFDIVYDKFIDKVKDRCKIEVKEWNEITREIIGQFPDVEPYVIGDIIQRHGWYKWYEGDPNADILVIAREVEGWVYKKK